MGRWLHVSEFTKTFYIIHLVNFFRVHKDILHYSSGKFYFFIRLVNYFSVHKDFLFFYSSGKFCLIYSFFHQIKVVERKLSNQINLINFLYCTCLLHFLYVGVYEYTLGGFQYGHCVKIIGYGKENGVPYWLASNSWGRNWGDSGIQKLLLHPRGFQGGLRW